MPDPDVIRLQERFAAHVEDNARRNGELAGDIAAVALRVSVLENRDRVAAENTGQWKLEQVTAERDKLAETNKHWFRYFVAVLITVVIMLSGAALGMLIKK